MPLDEPDILLVEDNPGDVNLVERAFDRRGLPGTVYVMQTGEQALDWLHGRRDDRETPRPDLILLDLNLPATSGHAVLEEIKSDDRLGVIPVVVLTGSRAEDDVATVYENGGNAYLTKPVDPEAFGDLIEHVVEFWTRRAVLPPETDPNGEE